MVREQRPSVHADCFGAARSSGCSASVASRGTPSATRVSSPLLKLGWTLKPAESRKAPQRVRALFDWCLAHGHVSENVGIKGGSPDPGACQAPPRSSPCRDVPSAYQSILGSHAADSARACAAFLVLTATRSAEAPEARWNECRPAASREQRAGARRRARGNRRDPALPAAGDGRLRRWREVRVMIIIRRWAIPRQTVPCAGTAAALPRRRPESWSPRGRRSRGDQCSAGSRRRWSHRAHLRHYSRLWEVSFARLKRSVLRPTSAK